MCCMWRAIQISSQLAQKVHQNPQYTFTNYWKSARTHWYQAKPTSGCVPKTSVARTNSRISVQRQKDCWRRHQPLPEILEMRSGRRRIFGTHPLSSQPREYINHSPLPTNFWVGNPMLQHGGPHWFLSFSKVSRTVTYGQPFSPFLKFFFGSSIPYPAFGSVESMCETRVFGIQIAQLCEHSLAPFNIQETGMVCWRFGAVF